MMRISKSDVQNRHLTNGFKLTRVGVTGVKKPVKVHREGKDTCLNCDIDVFVDLPSTQRGSHLSRNLEVIAEIVEQGVAEPIKGLEVLAADICRKLLDRHDYATYAEVHIDADYFLERTLHTGRKSVESYKLVAKASHRRGNGLSKMIGAQVIGMTACPCAMETVDEIQGNTLKPEGCLPTISHNQRNVTTAMLEVPEEFDVEADDLIEIVEASFSSPTFEILKRAEEAHVVINAHRNPKFVEDVVRDNLALILKRFPDLPDDTVVTVSSVSEESIHKHNAMAERVTTLGELRKDLE
ncbi:MAG: GTP cyclohydrolase I FolE2 [Methanomassiliicoccales archaeon]|nr:GTP cyclohydrolase I FolE2 [Methanomassiliicoccales archaeon]